MRALSIRQPYAGPDGPGTAPSLSALYLQAHRIADGGCPLFR